MKVACHLFGTLETTWELLPTYFSFSDNLVPFGFPMWICDIVLSVIDAIRDAKDQPPQLFRDKDEIMNVVEVDNQFVGHGGDRDGFVNVLVSSRLATFIDQHV